MRSVFVSLMCGALLVSAGAASAQSASGTEGRRAFAWWLEDADTMQAKVVVLSVSAGRWEGTLGGQTDAPVGEIVVGVTDWFRLGASVPYSNAKYSDGYTAKGRGDSYVTAKFRLVDGWEHPIGVAIAPMLEILSDAAVADKTLNLKRVNWALPLCLEHNWDKTRVYASLGYFSRGAVFAGAAVERTFTSWLTLSASVNFTRSLHALESSTLQPLSRNRFDGALTASFNLSSRVGLYVSAGRTLSKLDQNGGKLAIGAGLSLTIGGKPDTPAKPVVPVTPER